MVLSNKCGVVYQDRVSNDILKLHSWNCIIYCFLNMCWCLSQLWCFLNLWCLINKILLWCFWTVWCFFNYNKSNLICGDFHWFNGCCWSFYIMLYCDVVLFKTPNTLKDTIWCFLNCNMVPLIMVRGVEYTDKVFLSIRLNY